MRQVSRADGILIGIPQTALLYGVIPEIKYTNYVGSADALPFYITACSTALFDVTTNTKSVHQEGRRFFLMLRIFLLFFYYYEYLLHRYACYGQEM